MSFKLLLLQLGFTCSTAADKLQFILSDSQCLRAFNQGFSFFFLLLFFVLVYFTSESGSLLTYMKNIHFTSSLERPMELHGEIQRHAIVITYIFMTNYRFEDIFV